MSYIIIYNLFVYNIMRVEKRNGKLQDKEGNDFADAVARQGVEQHGHDMIKYLTYMQKR